MKHVYELSGHIQLVIFTSVIREGYRNKTESRRDIQGKRQRNGQEIEKEREIERESE